MSPLKTPGSVWLLCVLMVVVAIAIFLFTKSSGAAFSVIIITFTMIAGWRLGYQSGYLVVFFIAFLAIAMLILNDRAFARWSAIALLAYAAIIVYVMRRKTVLEFFKLICPQCKSQKLHACNFLYTKVRCPKCGPV